MNKVILIGDGGYDSYDFTGKLTLPGATSEKPNRILISNVALGEDYLISLKHSDCARFCEQKTDINPPPIP